MPHSTPRSSSPSDDCIRFIRTFARLYQPGFTSELAARSLAKLYAEHQLTKC